MSAERHDKRHRIALAAIAIVALAFGLGRASVTEPEAAPDSAAHPHDEVEEWTCSMHPEIRRSESGACPICGMNLIPVTLRGDDDAPTRVTLGERARTMARIRTSPVVPMGDAAGERHLIGRLIEDESTRRTVTAWIGGRIDRLHVRTTGEEIRRGQTIASLYSPEVYAAHQDLLEARRQVARLDHAGPSIRAAAEAALESTRQRLRLLGVPVAEVNRMQESDAPTQRVRIRSPFRGTVTARLAEEGSYVQTGAPLYRLADLGRLWLQLDAYEGDLAMLGVGQDVQFSVEALPGRSFTGTVSFIDPFVDPQRRTARVRVEVDNADGALRPGLFAEASVRLDEAEEPNEGEATDAAIFIPASAPLFTGRRSLVYVEVQDASDATYEIRPVRLGPRRGDVYPVLAGLTEGERVVTEGAFVLDADLQLRGGVGMMRWPDDRHPLPVDTAVQLPPQMRRGLASLFGAYLELVDALVSDELETAREAAADIAAATRRISGAETGAALERWDPMATRLLPLAEEIEGAADLPAARRGLHRLSDEATSLLTQFGNPLDQPLHLDHCPMALDGSGGDWIQAEADLTNPYFGDTMMGCGSVIGQVAPGAYLVIPPSREQATGGHRH